MEMRVFGRTGMQLSVLGFGCGAVGGLMVRRSSRPGAHRRAGHRCLRELLRHRGAVWQRRIGKSACSPAARYPDLPRVIRLRVRRPSLSARP